MLKITFLSTLWYNLFLLCVTHWVILSVLNPDMKDKNQESIPFEDSYLIEQAKRI